MQTTALRLQEVTGQIQGYAREQSHLAEDVVEIRRLVHTMSQRLWEGDPSFATRMSLIEREVDLLKGSQFRTRDFWMKVLAPLIVAATVAVTGLLGVIYVLSQGGRAAKP
jgi:hypothetical protein